MDYNKLTSIDFEQLEYEMINHAKSYFQVSRMLAEATSKLDRLNEQYKSAKASSVIAFKKQLQAAGKKPTLNDVELYVDTEPNLKSLAEKRIDLQLEKDVLFGLLRSLEHKKDMLKSLSWSGSRNGT